MPAQILNESSQCPLPPYPLPPSNLVNGQPRMEPRLGEFSNLTQIDFIGIQPAEARLQIALQQLFRHDDPHRRDAQKIPQTCLVAAQNLTMASVVDRFDTAYPLRGQS